LLAATASHGIHDAFTNGGLGIAFFAPFSAARYFFPVTPIEVSPIVHGFFSERGVRVLASEMVWVWTPALVLIAFSIGARRLYARHPS
jgi:inner membrane protein